MDKQSKNLKEIKQFISALVLRRIAQLGVRSEDKNLAPTSNAEPTNLYKLASELAKEFKDEKFQECSELAGTQCDDKNLSPSKFALLWAEAIPLGANIEDVKNNFPETEDITKKLLKISSGHPANLRENYLCFGSEFEKFNVLIPTQESRLPKPLDSDLCNLYEEIYKQAKSILGKITETNFSQKIFEIIDIFEPVPIQQKNGSLISLAGYIRSNIALGISLLKEIQKHGPTTIQDAKESYWCLSAIKFDTFGNTITAQNKNIEYEKIIQRLNIEIKREISKVISQYTMHLIDSTATNEFYLLMNKSSKDVLENCLENISAKLSAESSSVFGWSSELINEDILRDADKLSEIFGNLRISAHKNVQNHFLICLTNNGSEKAAVSQQSYEKLNKKTESELKITAPELISQSEVQQTRKAVTGYLLVQIEKNPQIILGCDKGLNEIFFQNDRDNKFWQKLPAGMFDKYNLKRSVIFQGKTGFILKSFLPNLLSVVKEFFITYFAFGMPVSISASIINTDSTDEDYNYALLKQAYRDARNFSRPKIRSANEQNNPFSGFRGSALALSFLDEKSKNIVPSEDLSIFYEMTRQVASLADFRMNHNFIEPLQKPKPEIFHIIHSLTHKLKNYKTSNWRANLYYILKKTLFGDKLQDVDTLTEQAINNLLTTLRLNRWQGGQRLMSRPAEAYLNLVAKVLSVIELI